jgi:malate dehydrogenase (oxaloacetate-decarboxylating)(NADP+)
MGLIYPPQSRILEASLHVAERDDVGALIRIRAYRPVYAQ